MTLPKKYTWLGLVCCLLLGCGESAPADPQLAQRNDASKDGQPLLDAPVGEAEVLSAADADGQAPDATEDALNPQEAGAVEVAESVPDAELDTVLDTAPQVDGQSEVAEQDSEGSDVASGTSDGTGGSGTDATEDAAQLADSGAGPTPDTAQNDATAVADEDSGTDASEQTDNDAQDPQVLTPCPQFKAPVTNGFVVSFKIKEGSGVAASQVTADTLWTHNDSGAGNQIFAISSTGLELASYKLSGTKAVDWEDIAVGPGPTVGASYVYVGDIGDNGESRSNIVVYRVQEPEVTASLLETTLTGVETLTLKYPDKAHNAETLLVDPLTGDLYIVVKDGDGTSPVFRAAAPLQNGQQVTLEQVASLQFGVSPLTGDKTTTAGDISPDGSLIAIRTYDSAYLWRRPKGISVGDALLGPPCAIPLAKEGQGEALGFRADGQGYYTFGEGSFVALSYYAPLP